MCSHIKALKPLCCHCSKFQTNYLMRPVLTLLYPQVWIHLHLRVWFPALHHQIYIFNAFIIATQSSSFLNTHWVTIYRHYSLNFFIIRNVKRSIWINYILYFLVVKFSSVYRYECGTYHFTIIYAYFYAFISEMHNTIRFY